MGLCLIQIPFNARNVRYLSICKAQPWYRVLTLHYGLAKNEICRKWDTSFFIYNLTKLKVCRLYFALEFEFFDYERLVAPLWAGYHPFAEVFILNKVILTLMLVRWPLPTTSARARHGVPFPKQSIYCDCHVKEHVTKGILQWRGLHSEYHWSNQASLIKAIIMPWERKPKS